jgi:hypothetical protein
VADLVRHRMAKNLARGRLSRCSQFFYAMSLQQTAQRLSVSISRTRQSLDGEKPFLSDRLTFR